MVMVEMVICEMPITGEWERLDCNLQHQSSQRWHLPWLQKSGSFIIFHIKAHCCTIYPCYVLQKSMGTDNQCKENYNECRVGQLTTSIVLLRCFQESVFWTYQMEFLEDLSLKTASLKGSQIISKRNTKAIQSIPYQNKCSMGAIHQDPFHHHHRAHWVLLGPLLQMQIWNDWYKCESALELHRI